MSEQIFPEPTCGALILNPKGEIFLMKSHKWHGKYVTPGGHIELGEKMEDSLKREIKEETGLQIYGIKFVCFHEFIYGKAFWKRRHFIFFDFACRTDNENVTLNSEGQEFTWITLEDALKLKSLEQYTRKTLEAY